MENNYIYIRKLERYISNTSYKSIFRNIDFWGFSINLIFNQIDFNNCTKMIEILLSKNYSLTSSTFKL